MVHHDHKGVKTIRNGEICNELMEICWKGCVKVEGIRDKAETDGCMFALWL
jgi:hypothetical protein